MNKGKNQGKIFEQDFRKSIPNDVYFLRLTDSAIGFDIKNSTQRFAVKSPYDCLMYKKPHLYCLELKSTKQDYIPFTGSAQMIKEHQVENLKKAAAHNCIAGFVLNFRTAKKTFFLPIKDYEMLTEKLQRTKKSLNIEDLELTKNCLLIPQLKLRTHCRYDVENLIRRTGGLKK